MNPKSAKHLLDKHPLVKPIGKSEKLAAYRLSSGRELALSIQNKQKTSLYIEVRPEVGVNVLVEKRYAPNFTKGGRHAHLNYLTEHLGFKSFAYRATAKTEGGLNELLEWYQRA